MPHQEGSEEGRGYWNRVVGKLPLEILALGNKTSWFGLKVTSRSFALTAGSTCGTYKTEASVPGCRRACTLTHKHTHEHVRIHTYGSFLPQLEVFQDSSESSPDWLLQEQRFNPTHYVQVKIFRGPSFLVWRGMSSTHRPSLPQMSGAESPPRTRLTSGTSCSVFVFIFLPLEWTSFGNEDHILHYFMTQPWKRTTQYEVGSQ